MILIFSFITVASGIILESPKKVKRITWEKNAENAFFDFCIENEERLTELAKHRRHELKVKIWEDAVDHLTARRYTRYSPYNCEIKWKNGKSKKYQKYREVNYLF